MKGKPCCSHHYLFVPTHTVKFKSIFLLPDVVCTFITEMIHKEDIKLLLLLFIRGKKNSGNLLSCM